MNHIAKYEILGLLGRGGMGKVYKIRIPLINKIAALKHLAPNPFLVDLIGLEKIRRMFLSEAVMLGRIRHSAIAEIWDIHETEQGLFYLMAYYCQNLGMMIGENFHPEEPSRPLTVEKTVHYARQILSGLACLHHAGIIHRDIKPYNILLTDEDQVKICDFGLSTMRKERLEGPPGLKIGSPFYAAPEQERTPETAGPEADLYSTGVMIHRMLTGRLPNPGGAPVHALNPALGESWHRFITKATAADPIHRFAHADQMREALEILHQEWLEKKDAECRLMEESETVPPKSFPVPIRLRKHPVKVHAKEARIVFPLDEFWRPRSPVDNHWIDEDPDTVRDERTGLSWQIGGSAYPLTWFQAKEYIQRLNESHKHPNREWRLPTVDELLSLLVPVDQSRDLCRPPLFDPTQKWVWSSDRRSFNSAWYVSMDMGYTAWHDMTGFFYVKAVRDTDV